MNQLAILCIIFSSLAALQNADITITVPHTEGHSQKIEIFVRGSLGEPSANRPTSYCETSEIKPTSCAEILLLGNNASRNYSSGLYTIYPKPWWKKDPFQVYCDMETDGGGWTVFQRRGVYEVRENFYRGWNDYQKGFGDLQKEFWLGNDYLHLLTNQDSVILRVDLEDYENSKRYAEYKLFRVASGKNKYKLSFADYSGDAGNSLESGKHNNMNFITYDNGDVKDCSKKYKGGWWYNQCHWANLNGLNLNGNVDPSGISWHAWKNSYYSLKKSEMKIRPSYFPFCEN